MTESNEKVESPKEKRRSAEQLIAGGVGIAVSFTTLILFANFTAPPKSTDEMWFMVGVAAIPGIAAGMIVTGILRYIDSHRTQE